jgi:hypothetical protein
VQNFISLLKTHPRRALAAAVVLVIVLGVGGFLIFRHFYPSKPVVRTNTDVATKAPEPVKPTTKASPLTGVEVDPALADRPITAVVIENHPDARPQAGLGQAGVVYEALAEGGITRFLAFFLDQRPAKLGPVRSIRTYFVDWALEFNAPVAHAGGNADALDLIGPLGMKDMNQFYHGSSFYRSGENKAIEHTLFTTSDQLDAMEAALGYNKPADFAPSPRKADNPPAAGAAATHPNIHIDYSYNGYQVDYAYSAATNDYARSMAGVPHLDRNTGEQIHVKNIVVEYMPTSFGTTRIGEQTVIMATPGSGKAIVFHDGTAIEGTWSKASHSQRTQLMDASGNPIALDAGNTWYSIVPTTKVVTY